MTLVDGLARERALDVTRSLCVSAPAGSGKTGLLVLRYLALLARSETPERVVAITFTRKAAAEMRLRVTRALKRANDPVAHDDSHGQKLQALTKAVLEQDARLEWGLAASPSRLRIQTIDSFCAELCRQMPILSGSGGALQASDDNVELFRMAVDSFLHRELASDDLQRRNDLRQLLLYLDNNWQSASELLSRLLARREQWQPVFGGAGLGNMARQDMRGALKALVAFRIEELKQRIGSKLSTLAELLAFRAENLPSTPAFASDDLHGVGPKALQAWQSLAALLLTQGGTWRKSITKREGFPAGKGVAAQRKAALKSILDELSAQNDSLLLAALRQLSHFPALEEGQEHWDMLSALTRMLPRLGAELLLVFKQEGAVDHSQVALAALSALGEDDAPTDIALRLHERIDHLLVDEFQDTSSLQFELVRRLTRGWAEHNASHPTAARTLLLVGDPMQSIYGFREANVGLFIRARDEGVGELKLEPLELRVNFRSQGGLVSWVNQAFADAFPDEDDAQRGAVRLRPATAARASGRGPELALFSGDGAEAAELKALCARVAEGVDDPNVNSIAILGRSRTQLRPVLEALRAAQIPAIARDLDPLAQRPVVRDLLSLALVLLDHHDRYAWLALLRSPAAGFDHADLLVMARHLPTAGALIAAEPDVLHSGPSEGLSKGARERMGELYAFLQWADQYRDRLSLRVWIEECWLRLHGAALLKDSRDTEDAAQFFALLGDLEARTGCPNPRQLEEAVARLSASSGDETAKVEVMTLHKAKGLEFDWVFIPALARGTADRDQELLLWDEFTLPHAGSAFLLDIKAPNSAAQKTTEGTDEPGLYSYLKAQAKQKRAFEATRLFYVGCTRAADYLWLGASLKWDEKTESVRSPAGSTLLAAIWTSVSDCAVTAPTDGDAKLTTPMAQQRLQRVRSIAAMELLTNKAQAQAKPLATPITDNRVARGQGTAVHRCLESLCYRDTLPTAVDPSLLDLLRVALLEAGVDSVALLEQLELGKAALNRCLKDSWLRWALSPQQRERAAEHPLTLVREGRVAPLILDYTFLSNTEVREPFKEAGVGADQRAGAAAKRDAVAYRWVIDYKSAAPRDGEGESAFMARQLAIYADQLAGYRAALHAAHAEPVRCALYFTALGRHAEYRA